VAHAQRLPDMVDIHPVVSGQVRHGAGDSQGAVEATRGQPEPIDRRRQRSSRRHGWLTLRQQLGDAQPGVVHAPTRMLNPAFRS